MNVLQNIVPKNTAVETTRVFNNRTQELNVAYLQ